MLQGALVVTVTCYGGGVLQIVVLLLLLLLAPASTKHPQAKN